MISHSIVFVVFTTLGRNLYSEQEENLYLNSYTDLKNIFKYLQNLARELLYYNKEYERLVEETFVLPCDNSGIEKDNILEMIDTHCDILHKSKEFSSKAMHFINNSKNSKGIKIQYRYQEQYTKYYKDNNTRNKVL